MDSIWKLTRTQYDLVVVDEATFVRFHFVSGTIDKRIAEVVDKFRQIMRSAKKIIIMQHQITERCIEFYCEAAEIDPEVEVTRRKLDRPLPLHPRRYTNDDVGLLALLASTYVDNIPVDKTTNTAILPSKCPIVVFCTRADHARLLYTIIRSLANEKFGPQAAERIKGIWSAVQDEPWAKAFLRDPARYDKDADVLIVTTVLQAGHSLDKWFRISFDFMFVGTSLFREELQFIARLRIIDREDELAPEHFSFVQKGKANAYVASYLRQCNFINDLSVDDDISRYLSTVLASVRSEFADTCNRHHWLWSREYAKSKVSYNAIRFPIAPGASGEFTRDWAANRIKDWCLANHASLRSYLADFEHGRTTLLRELDYAIEREVNITLNLHMSKVSRRIAEHIRCGNHRGGMHVLVYCFGKKLPDTECKVKARLNATYQLGAYLDYCLSRSMQPLDFESSRYYQARQKSFSRIPGSKQVTIFAEFIFYLLQLYGAFTAGRCRLHLDAFSKAPSWDDIENLLKDHPQFESAYNYTVRTKDQLQIRIKRDKRGRKTPNGLLSICLRRCSLSVKHKRKTRLVNVMDSLLMLKAVSEKDHYLAYRNIIDESLWAATEAKFSELVEETHSAEYRTGAAGLAALLETEADINMNNSLKHDNPNSEAITNELKRPRQS